MKTIWKYQFDEDTENGEAGFDAPNGFTVLSVQMQQGRITLWTLVDTDRAKFRFVFKFYGTGEEIPTDPGNYAGTVQSGCLVWHCFVLGVL